MSEGMNKVMLIGNLCADPETRYTQGGTAILNLRLACNERRKINDQWQDHAEFVGVVVWGKRGEGLGGFLTKGQQIAVEGKLRTSSWEKDGQKHYKTEVHADNVVLCGNGGGGKRTTKQKPQNNDDDIPF